MNYVWGQDIANDIVQSLQEKWRISEYITHTNTHTHQLVYSLAPGDTVREFTDQILQHRKKLIYQKLHYSTQPTLLYGRVMHWTLWPHVASMWT